MPPRHLARPGTTPLRFAVLALAAALLGLAAAPVSAATDLGDLNGGGYSTARAINLKGQSIGNAMDGATLSTKQVLWRGKVISSWSACCGSGLGVPQALNLSREAAGYIAAGFDDRPVYWSGTGGATELPPLPGGNGRGQASDINDAGYVVGFTRDASGSSRRAVVWHRTSLFLDLGFMGTPAPGQANQSLAYGINKLGDVVGASLVGSEFHAFFWRNGHFTDLGPGTALDITDDGLVMGNAPGFVPVLWRAGVREHLPALSGAAVAYGHTVRAMNNLGDVVGFAPALKAPYFDTAVLWRQGRAINLGRYPGGTVSRAYGINDKGQIVGEGNLVPGGPMHALRWSVGTGQAVAVSLQ